MFRSILVPASGTRNHDAVFRTALAVARLSTGHLDFLHVRDPGEMLLSAARESEADLLVMGGCSRSRLREVVFGGVTRHVLRSASMPVLMSH